MARPSAAPRRRLGRKGAPPAAGDAVAESPASALASSLETKGSRAAASR